MGLLLAPENFIRHPYSLNIIKATGELKQGEPSETGVRAMLLLTGKI